MDGVVHAPKPRGEDRGFGDQGIPRVDAHRHMMVPVEEREGALAKDDEECVTKLHQFRHGEYPAPQCHTCVCEAVTVTGGVEQAVSIDVAG